MRTSFSKVFRREPAFIVFFFNWVTAKKQKKKGRFFHIQSLHRGFPKAEAQLWKNPKVKYQGK